MELTKDTYEYLLNFADDRTLLNMLSVSKKFAEKLENDNFFEQLLNKRYPFLLEFINTEESFKNFYLRKIYYISKIEEKYKLPYYQLKGYDPEYFYNFYIYLENPPYNADIKKYLLQDILLTAAKVGNINVAKEALKYYKFNLNGALSLAASYGQLDMLKFLISQGADDYDRALEEAANSGQLEIIKYLVEKYHLRDFNNAIEIARENNHQDILEYLEKIN